MGRQQTSQCLVEKPVSVEKPEGRGLLGRTATGSEGSRRSVGPGAGLDSLPWTPVWFQFGGKEPWPFHRAHFSPSFSACDASSVYFWVVTRLFLMYHWMESLPFLRHGWTSTILWKMKKYCLGFHIYVKSKLNIEVKYQREKKAIVSRGLG